MYGNRRRIKGEHGKKLLRSRGELVERSFAHAYETGGMRRLHLRGRDNILKRLLIQLGTERRTMVEPVLRPGRRADNRGRPWHDTRAVLNGVLWVLGTGAQWRELPEKCPPFQTCHRRFQQWVRSGKFEQALSVRPGICMREAS